MVIDEAHRVAKPHQSGPGGRPQPLEMQGLIAGSLPGGVMRRAESGVGQVQDVVTRREKAERSTIEDVSDPHLKAGLDLKILRADGELRYVEVKRCSGVQAAELTENEWGQAVNHWDRYWLYVAYRCDAVPQLYHVPDPFGRLLARQMGTVRIKASAVIVAAT